MGDFDTVRSLARHWHEEARAKAGGISTASALLAAATELTGIERQGVGADDPLLCGAEAILEPSTPAIFYKNSVSTEQAAFYQAHEFGHHWLASSTGGCTGNDIVEDMPEEKVPLGMQRVEGYGSRERCECQANVFAREFLLPGHEAKRLFTEERLSALIIANRLGLPLGLVQQQLAWALLIPEVAAAIKTEGERREAPGLDDSQRKAAEAVNGPFLVEAGPGTGKTRTLIARIEWLIGRGTVPASILALTFSNKAAEEIRERVALAAPAAAPAIWAGTFHAFGLELLHKYGHLLNLPLSVKLVDPGDALLLLEEKLPELPLNHYLQLYEPAFALRDILAAISRAKDELIGPDKYRKLGETMLRQATNKDEREKAERVIEVANVFAAYERILEEAQVVDFADLILKPINLLSDHPEIAQEIRTQYGQILVDEYQDVNRASGVLLKLLAGDGETLWVVGDARQSIYRFRGASPVNIRGFEKDFPGAKRLPLEINYRSQQPMVRLIEAFAPQMKASTGGLPAKWKSHRGSQGGMISMEIATNQDAEGAGLAQEINLRRNQGIAYREQALLCRSHTHLARFAKRLEELGIPVLYLGDVFERPEVRDMLSLLSLTCEPERGGLLRVAQFPEYCVPIDDVRKILTFAGEQDIFPIEALTRLTEITDLTPAGRDKLALLANHLADITPGTTPAALLFDYLFTKSRYLDNILADRTVSGQQKRLALFQILQFAVEYKPLRSGIARQQLLQWVRRLETFGDERQLRQLPAAAAGIDAVRLLTVHASKGLEFKVVYLPALGKSMFPVSQQYNQCPPPDGMLAEDPKETHDEEEECLFFVAMSRARDFLCFSRAEDYGVKRSESPLLTKIAAHLPYLPGGPSRWNDSVPTLSENNLQPHLAPKLDVHTAEDLDQYMKCPLAYLYQRVLKLSGARDDNAYVRFHRAVYAVLRWMSSFKPAEPITREQALDRLKGYWAEIGPSDHPYANVYLNAAVAIVERAVTRRATCGGVLDAEWHIERPGGRIRVRPDHVESGPEGLIVRRLRTGRPPKKAPDDDLYALYHHCAAKELRGARIEVLYLTTNETVAVSMTDKVISKRLKKYDNAIEGIRIGNFPPNHDDRNCPRCPQYFICPAVPHGKMTTET